MSHYNEIRQLEIRDIDQVFKIEDEVGKMNVSLVIKSTDSEIVKCMESKLSTGIFDAGELLSYTLCYVDEYKSVGYIEKCATKESHRGKGYHEKTLSLCIEMLRDKDYVVALALVSEINVPSMKNFMLCGFERKAVRKNLFDCTNERNVMVCNLK